MEATRREFLAAVTSAAFLTTRWETVRMIDPPSRSGRPFIKAGIAAYSYRDRLTGKAAPAMTMVDFVKLAAEQGWDGVELTSYYFPVPVDNAYLAEVKRLCFVNGLQVAGSSVGNVFTHPRGPARDAEIEKVKAWITHAARLGSPALRVFAGALQPGQTQEEAERLCIECLEECAEVGAREGVMLALENHGGIVPDAESTLRIVKAVGSPWVGVNLDTGNFRTDDPYEDMKQCAPYAVTTHLKTEVQRRGKPPEPADIRRIVRILADSGYRGFLTLEYEAREPVDAAAPRTLAAIREAVAAI